jgi:imidazolonepropionase-like amidohydrolase
MAASSTALLKNPWSLTLPKLTAILLSLKGVRERFEFPKLKPDPNPTYPEILPESMELRIVEARLPGREDLWEIAIADGLISQIDRTVTGTNILNAQGQLVIPGLVDAHMHLDKVYLLDRSQRREGTFGEAMRETLKAKQAFTIADIQTRARRGATAM